MKVLLSFSPTSIPSSHCVLLYTERNYSFRVQCLVVSPHNKHSYLPPVFSFAFAFVFVFVFVIVFIHCIIHRGKLFPLSAMLGSFCWQHNIDIAVAVASSWLLKHGAVLSDWWDWKQLHFYLYFYIWQIILIVGWKATTLHFYLQHCICICISSSGWYYWKQLQCITIWTHNNTLLLATGLLQQ